MSTPIGPRGAAGFLAAAAAWVVALFGLLRIPLVEDHVVLPLTRAQGWLATLAHVSGPLPVAVTLECSGTDMMALLAAVPLAYPCPWPRRLRGAALGVLLLAAANVVRIASLSGLAGTPAFLPAHLYVWPAALGLLALAYAGGWLWAATAPADRRPSRWLPFAAVAASLVCLFVAMVPALQRSAFLDAATRAYAAAAAAVLAAAGLAARAEGSVLFTGQGAFLVTPECLVTPLMPVFLAAALTLPRTVRGRLAALSAFLPAFALLAGARLLTLALPVALVGSPIAAIHGFHQVVLGALAVLALAHRAGRAGRTRRLALAAGAALVALLAAPAYGALVSAEAGLLTSLIPHLRPGPVAGDGQGALASLPAFQLGLLAAAWLAATGGRRLGRLAGAAAVLHATQLALLVGAGELARHAGLALPVTLLRGWALAAPLGLFFILRDDAGRGGETNPAEASGRNPMRQPASI